MPTPQNGAAQRLALEPRFMFDAAAVATAADVAAEAVVAEQSAAFVNALFQKEAFQKEAPGVSDADAEADSAASAQSDRRVDAVRGAMSMRDVEALERALGFEGIEPPTADLEDGRAEIDDADIGDSDTAMRGDAADRVEIAFVDSSVADVRQLVAGLSADVEVVLISADHDGLEQMRAVLDGRENIDAIHILAHGSDGYVTIGNSRLDTASIAGTYADALADIGSSLTEDGDILVYGCRFGLGEDGDAAMRALADATGADISASDDDTGAAALGGDWVLERQIGVRETLALASESWNALLAPAIISVTSGPVVTNAGSTVGTTALWSNAGTVGGNAIDLRATVISATAQDTIAFGRSGDDPSLTIRSGSGNTRDLAQVTVRWEMFRAGTQLAIAGDVGFTVTDVDGQNGVPRSREIIAVSSDDLVSYTTAGNSSIAIDSRPGFLEASGLQNQNVPNQPGWIRFNWSNLSTWDITYSLVVNSRANAAGFSHDGDGDRVFTGGGNTQAVPRIDLDADNSTAAQTRAQTTYTSQGAPVAIVDTDVDITQSDTVDRATVVLTNAEAGDRLDIADSLLPAGITASVDESVPGRITVRFTGAASDADYEAALRSLFFSSSADVPPTAPRQIEVSVESDPFTSNTAISTVDIVPVSRQPILDLDGPENIQLGAIWRHNNPPGSRAPEFGGGNVIVSASDEMTGPGIDPEYISTITRVTDANEDSFAGARAAGDYFSYEFRTADVLPDIAAIAEFQKTR
ncbi:MAG: DUF4347 domain-containing protein, partial [Pseudomonadota bacterium]